MYIWSDTDAELPTAAREELSLLQAISNASSSSIPQLQVEEDSNRQLDASKEECALWWP